MEYKYKQNMSYLNAFSRIKPTINKKIYSTYRKCLFKESKTRDYQNGLSNFLK